MTVRLQKFSKFSERGHDQIRLAEHRLRRGSRGRLQGRCFEERFIGVNRAVHVQGHMAEVAKMSPGAFTSNAGGQIKTAWKGAIRRSGLDPELTPHDLRHTWASWHHAMNVNLSHSFWQPG